MSKSSAALLTLMLLVAAAASAGAPDTVVLASVVDQHDSYAGRLLQLIYGEAFRRLHLSFELRTYPAARASVEAVAGNVDGEAVRAYDYGSLHPELVRVEEPLLSVTTSAYTHDPSIHLHGWESLRGTAYRVEYHSGYQVTQLRIEAVVPADHLSAIGDGQQGLRKLAMGRTDVYVDNDESVLPLLARAAYRKLPIYRAGVLESTPVYAYLTRPHAALAPRLAAVLGQMKAEGLIERYKHAAAQAGAAP